MFNKGNNGGGNPNHDENGRFTSGSNKASGNKNNYESKIKKALGMLDSKEDNQAFNGTFDEVLDRYNKLSDEQKMDFALNVYKYGTDSFDNPLGKFKDPYTGEIMYADPENNYEDVSNYLLANDEDSKQQLLEALNDIIDAGASKEDLEQLFKEHKIEEIPPYDDDDSEYEEKIKSTLGVGSDEDEIDYRISNIENRLMYLDNLSISGLSPKEQHEYEELESELESLRNKKR